ncbi:MAG: PaaI family thioesterase [Candidatus Cyclobacteriaceae bacterium M2_1C_046]
MNQEHYKKLEHMYLNANINSEFFASSTIQITDEMAKIELPVDEKYFHALGGVHGSVYFKLLDDAAFFAVNSVIMENFVLTTSFNLHLIRPADKGKLKAVGKIKFKSKDSFIAESFLYNDRNKEIAFGTGTFVRSKKSLSEEIGYK